MTARDIQRRLLADCYRRKTFACPNYTPKKWWECDVFELTKTNRFREYEIKLSRADFRADRWKAENYWDFTTNQRITRKKYDCLSSRDASGPTLFWYVTPAGLIAPEEVPEWAGLLYCESSGRNSKPPWNIRIETAKEAPRLHNSKTDEMVTRHLLRTFYHRFQWWFIYDQKEAA